MRTGLWVLLNEKKLNCNALVRRLGECADDWQKETGKLACHSCPEIVPCCALYDGRVSKELKHNWLVVGWQRQRCERCLATRHQVKTSVKGKVRWSSAMLNGKYQSRCLEEEAK